MLKAHSKGIRIFAVTTDAVLIATALAGAWFYGGGSAAHGSRELAWLTVVLLPLWLFLLKYFELYGPLRRRTRTDLALSVLKMHVLGGSVMAVLLVLTAPDLFYSGVLPVFLLASFLLLGAEKVLIRSGLGFFRRHGFNTRNLLIVGRPEEVGKFNTRLAGHADWGLVVLGALLTEEENGKRLPPAIRNLGSFQQIVEVCKFHPVDEVIFCTPQNLVPKFEKKLARLQELGVTVRVVLESFDSRYSKKDMGFLCDDIPFLTIHSNKLDSEAIFLKRVLDLFGALNGLLFTALIFPFVALAIKLESPGPILFVQQRVGENGRLFTVWKFRSMYLDAEARKQELLAHNEMNGAIFKISNDPRITRVGRFLRRTSLDECPQFWNVLVGDMSLVGTRPPTPDEVAGYENWHRRRISIRPGITGVWQISGRNRISDFDEIVRLDLSYIDSWTPWLDLKILWKTVQVVLFRHGSC